MNVCVTYTHTHTEQWGLCVHKGSGLSWIQKICECLNLRVLPPILQTQPEGLEGFMRPI